MSLSIGQLSERYDGWMLDLFGCLQDGKNAYPAALEAVARLQAERKRLVLISNSSRRAATTLDKVVELGFPRDAFVGAVTSGELTHQALLTRADPWFARLGRRCLHFTWAGRGAISLDGLDLEVVRDVAHADFILAHGTEARGPEVVGLQALLDMLPAAARRGLPLVCANPDVVTVSGDALLPMPGTIAVEYRRLGVSAVDRGRSSSYVYPPLDSMCYVYDASMQL